MKLTQRRDGVVPYPDDMVARYRADGLWHDRTIPDEFRAVARRTPDAPALAGPRGRYTYAELDAASDRVAAGLVRLGLPAGGAVLMQIENTEWAVVAWYGLLKAALVPVATLSVHREHEIGPIAAQTDAVAHLVQADLPNFDLVAFARDLADRTDPSRVVLGIGDRAPTPGVVAVETLGAELDDDTTRALAQVPAASDDVAVFQLSGGTTGVPKVIPRLHAEYWYNARAYAERLGWDDTTRIVHMGPLMHNVGIVCALHPVHGVGGTFVVGTRDLDVMLPLMADVGITDTTLQPGVAAGMREHPLFEAAFARARRIVLSGSAISEELFESFDGRGIRVAGLFGMGEGLCTVTPLDDPAESRRLTVGSPISPLDEVRILEPGTETPVPEGETGELCARGPYTLRGYLSAPERNAEAFTSDGFYRTGDLMSLRRIEGLPRYVFEGRAKDLVNRGGEKINSAEIEALALQLPGVRCAGLIPVPDARLGERACLCLELEPDVPPVELDDLQRFLEDRGVAKYKWPEFIEHFDELPRTPVGKIDKRRLGATVTTA
ncbi:AMP-binding protein [Pseudonocardia sp.]|jgi:non-ribosomal peptide synthetase component E (peptide arylation enzyme)|uniref:AMP-binding protein n=1 Tax=Pseudonocardia sp. TaxID=60912 RepID=UPI003D095C11